MPQSTEYYCIRTHQSSAIKLIGYNKLNKKLLIIFNNNSATEYSFIESFIFENLLLSESVGTSYQLGIKGAFPSTKWTEEQTSEFLKTFEQAEREQLIRVSISE